MDFLENLALERARIAAEIVEAQPRDEAQQPVEGAVPQRLEPAAGPRLAIADGDIGVAERRDELADLARLRPADRPAASG